MAKKKEETAVVSVADQSQSLAQLMHARRQLETQFLDDGGVAEESMIKLWEDTQLAIPLKIDAYGYVMDKLSSQIEFLKNEKQEIDQAAKSIENNIKTMKKRLSYFANGVKLEGLRYNFNPYVAKKRDVSMPKVPKTVGTYSVGSLTFEELQDVIAGLTTLKGLMTDGPAKDKINSLLVKFATSEHSCSIKEAEAGCPDAIITASEESVKVTRKGSGIDTSKEAK